MPRASMSDIQFQRQDSEEQRLAKLRRLTQAVDELARRGEKPAETPIIDTDIIVNGPALVGRVSGTGAAEGLGPDEVLSILPRTRIRGAAWASAANIAIRLPINDVYVQVKEACRIRSVTILTTSTAVGSCVIDIRKIAFEFFPPSGGDTICGDNKPTILNARTFTDDTLTGWTTELAAGDVLGFVLQSTSNFKTITIQLELETT